MNTPVSFELAKLLTEKEIIFKTEIYYSSATKVTSVSYTEFAAPTIAEVVMWLYEKHEIWISVDWMSRTKPYNSGFYCHLRGTNKNLNQDNFVSINNTKEPGYEVFNSPTEAYEAAIEYTLNNLVLTKNK